MHNATCYGEATTKDHCGRLLIKAKPYSTVASVPQKPGSSLQKINSALLEWIVVLWKCKVFWEMQSPVTMDGVIGVHKYFKFME